jgi:hypothetical protein
MQRKLTTLQLRPGDVLLVGGKFRRTVREVEAWKVLGTTGEQLYAVRYVESADRDWSDGNSGVARTTWTVLNSVCPTCGSPTVPGVALDQTLPCPQ